ncbi:uncharacterized protein PITG_22633, partial [Phytophthora infestans T30-4]
GTDWGQGPKDYGRHLVGVLSPALEPAPRGCDRQSPYGLDSTGNSESKTLNRLVFPKHVRQFGVWKDLIIGHLRQKSTALAREAMLKGQEKPAFKYEELLVTSCE